MKANKSRQLLQLLEKSAPGFEGSVLAMKRKHPEITNPWALSWYLKHRGAKSHYTPTGKKKKQRND